MYFGFDEMKKKYGLAIIGFVYAAMIVQTLFFYSQLPETLAAHFDFQGQPSRWLGKFWFFALYFAFQVALTSLLWLLGRACRKLPAQWVRIPNKEFWFRSDTQHRLFEMNEATMVWIAAITSLLLLFVAQLVFHANLSNNAIDSLAIWMTIVVYLFAIVGIVLYYFRSLRVFN